MGRPRKYASVDEYLAARREQDRRRREQRKRERPTRYFEPQETPPPAEVLREREHRLRLRMAHLLSDFDVPPPSYAGHPGYYVKAWRIQRRIARGQHP